MANQERFIPMEFSFVKDFPIYGKDPDGKINTFLQELYFGGGKVDSITQIGHTTRVVYAWLEPHPLVVPGTDLELFTTDTFRKTFGGGEDGEGGSDVGDAPDVPAGDG